MAYNSSRIYVLVGVMIADDFSQVISGLILCWISITPVAFWGVACVF